MKHRKLYVIAVISNPVRFKSRIKLYHQFEKYISQFPNAVLYTCELAFGGRDHEITSADNPRHIQLRSEDELWTKECLINLAVARLPCGKDGGLDDGIAWVDADVSWLPGPDGKDIITETLHQLMHYHIVQMFSTAIDLGPNNEVLQVHQGFVKMYLSGAKRGHNYTFWHPGFAWACTRRAWNGFGGLIDWACLGAGDHHMALGMIGEIQYSVPGKISKSYLKKLHDWQHRCETHIKRDIGYVNMTLLHNFHGAKKDRKYVERWSIITDNNFDPDVDLKRDWQGVYTLTDRSIKLRDQIRAYFRQRNEDNIDID